MDTRRWTIGAVAVVAFAATACSNGGTSPAPTTPTTTPSQVAGGTGVTIHPSSSVPPTGPPGLTGVLTAGSASLTIRDGVDKKVKLGQLTNLIVYSADPDGAFVLAWSDGGKQLLTMGGKTFTGERTTSSALTLNASVDDGGHLEVLGSSAGECTIDVATATSSEFSGSFSCSGVPVTGETTTADLRGTFEATG